jgi:preprotein translocase subunit SecA
MERLNIPPDVPVESKVVTRAIRSAQTQVEQQNFEIRKDVLKYDDVMNRQRVVIYGERRKVLEGADLHEQISEFVDEVIEGYVEGETSEGYPEEWDLDKLWRAFGQLYPVSLTIDDVIEEAGGDRAGLTGEFITEQMIADAQGAYERREQEFGSEVMREVERRVVLSVLDRKWREHLYEMDYLREGIGLRGYGQRDPLIEYQREGYDMFSAMMDGIKEESVGHLFNLQVQIQENPIVEEQGGAGGPGSATLQIGGPAPSGPAVGGPTGAAAGGAAAGGAPAPAGQGARRTPRPPDGASRSGGAHARGGAPDQGAAAPRRDGRVSGAQGQPSRRDGRASGGAHARRPGAPAAGQNVPAEPNDPIPAGFAPRRPQRLQYSAPSVDGGTHVEHSQDPGVNDAFAHAGRNDPCPCGSGRKFKRCHGDPRNRPDGP